MKAFVTGCSRGIGESISKQLKSLDIEVISPTRDELNLSDPESIKDYLSNIQVDILINNAGINNLTTIENTKYSDLLETYNVNYFSPYLICSHFINQFKKNNYGRIVNISSIWGSKAKEKRSVYSSSKSSIHTLTRQIVAETKGFNILTNTVSPGFISTELTFKNNSKEEIEKIKETIPVKKLGTTEEIAKWVINLTTDNEYINGQEIIIDGGVLCVV